MPPSATATTFDAPHLQALREDTPGTQSVLHFNNAGSALPPLPVLDAQVQHLQREAEIGGYEAAAEAAEDLKHTYTAIARMLGCTPEEVAIVENATRAWDMAFYGYPFETGDRILTSTSAYASNYIAALQVAERTGATVEVMPSAPDGTVDPDTVREQMDERVAMITLTHVPTNGGLVNPAAEIGAIAQEWEVPYLLDACQSAGQMPLDIDALGCTMLSATGRKYLRGPRGTGFLYVDSDWLDRLDPPFLDLHAATWTGPDSYEVNADATRFETWEGHVAGKIGLGVAVEYALDIGLDAIFGRLQHLAESLRSALRTVDSVTVHDAGTTRCGITTFSAEPAMMAGQIQTRLRARDVNVSVSTPPSTLLDATSRDLPDLVRASIHYYNTEEEIERFVTELSDVLSS